MDWSRYLYILFLLPVVPVLLYLAFHSKDYLLDPKDTSKQPLKELFFLVAILVFGMLAIYWNFYSGAAVFAYKDVGSDTLEQYLPFYINLIRSVRSGSLGFWNFQYGLGASFMSFQSWTLDPFNLVLIPLGLMLGESHIGLILMIVHSLRILVSGVVFDRLLTYYCKTPLARILGASVFALSGYLLLWGQHYWLGTPYVMTALLLLALERLLDGKGVPSYLFVVACVAVSILMGTYSGYMVLLFAAPYALVRSAYVADSPREFLSLFGRLALPAICGCLISALTVIPYASLLVSESTRISSSGSGPILDTITRFLSANIPLSWIPLILSRFLGASLVSAGVPIPETVAPPTELLPYVNTYEVLVAGASCALFILIGLHAHWAFREGTVRDRVMFVVTAIFVGLYSFNLFLPALSNALAAAKYRSSFVLVVVFAITIAVAWEKRIILEAPSRPVLVISIFATLAVCAWSLLATQNGRLDCLAFIGLTALLFVVLWKMKDSPQREALVICAAMLVIASVMVDGFFTTNNRGFAEVEDVPGMTAKDADTLGALAFIRKGDSSHCRVEKLYTDWTHLSDSLVQNYSGISSYNSTIDADLADFYRTVWPEVVPGDSAYQIFEADPLEPELLSFLGVRYLLSHEPLSEDWLEPVHQEGDVYVYENKQGTSLLTLYDKAVSEDELRKIENPADRRALLADTIVVADVAGVSPAIPEATDKPSGAQPALVSLKGQTLEASSSSDRNALACLSVPYSDCWRVLVDGKPAKTFRANVGFVGFELPAGQHSVRASFVPPRVEIAAGVSLFGLVLAIACAPAYRKERPSAEAGHFARA